MPVKTGVAISNYPLLHLTPGNLKSREIDFILPLRFQITPLKTFIYVFLDPRGGSLSLTHIVVLNLLLVDFFVSQPTVFIETS